MSANAAIPEVLREKLVAYIQKSAGQLHEAAQRDIEFAKQAEAVQNIAPAVVDELINAGLIDNEKRAQALNGVHNPVLLLNTLYKAAKVVGQQKQAAAAPAPESLGKPETIKSAGASSAATSKLKESDKLFMERFGFIG